MCYENVYMPKVLLDKSKSVQHAIRRKLAPVGIVKFLKNFLHYIVCDIDHPLEL